MPRLSRTVMLLLLFAASPSVAWGDVLRVGPDRRFPSPEAAAHVARDGDVIEIDAGAYDGGAAVWTANNLVIRGVGEGRAHMRANGHAAGLGLWIIRGRNTTVENIEFSGARASTKNGAGIRQEGVGLTVRNCYFHDNENGILGGGGDGEVVVERSEFAANGHGDGQSHNIYINRVKRFTLRASYSHHTRIGHNVKSRAERSDILYNRIMDEASGTSSYAIDLPEGGLAYVIGNLVQQGPHTDNPTILAYGSEGLTHPVNELYVVNNTFVNELPEGARFVTVAPGAQRVLLVNNIFAGRATVLVGPGELSHNVVTTTPGFVDPARYDYRLRKESPAVDAGTDPGVARGVSLVPRAEYAHPLGEVPRPRAGRLDAGAHEYVDRKGP